ncbi:aminotransferase class I/II-fold pyridoxal phosphate-dependent enzyme [Thiospirochaeta perfilievii]|uniref:Aminotransferase class I/II-fold pyridoxal phosphate-dependent enzyme n=1 Tax=Thiospirochaeta perfilievii TaxID=252967 RepID=A0A5C1QDH3_9SPIO|nr:GntG family PLP-dependent aldolase [Thiospirochaeta perfilievii]QEN05120.1 aminotransferase class I/II-fold pyridoxal phosphate-dependent enzyme [Thiospirochaeta perfilievii]
MNIYDLRSDTITKPSEAMRKAMYKAQVGDDVYGEDPTVNKLQELSNKITGKKSSLFVSSGSMANLITLFINGGRGKDVLMHNEAHSLHHELGAPAAIAGVNPIGVPGERGILRSEILQEYVNPKSGAYHDAKTSMIIIENTHNFAGGTCYYKENLKDVQSFAHKYGLSLHIDGARIFNASIATGLSVKEISSYADTITFCLAKGLGAPVGAILSGSKEFIDEAKIVRKMLGGGLRQSGIIAAGGLYALEHNIPRLIEDHINAKTLAKCLNGKAWAKVDPNTIETNILFFDTVGIPASKLERKLARRGILCFATGENTIRFVTSLSVTKQDINSICGIINSLEI